MIWASASCTLIILPNSVGCLALPRRMTSVVGSKMLTRLPLRVRVAAQHSRPCLSDHLLDSWRHGLQFFLHRFQSGLLHYIGRMFHFFRDVFGKSLSLSHH